MLSIRTWLVLASLSCANGTALLLHYTTNKGFGHTVAPPRSAVPVPHGGREYALGFWFAPSGDSLFSRTLVDVGGCMEVEAGNGHFQARQVVRGACCEIALTEPPSVRFAGLIEIGPPLVAGRWSHFIISHSLASGVAKFFVDGQEVADKQIDVTQACETAADYIMIGRAVGIGLQSAYWRGQVTAEGHFDDLQVYTRALTAADAAAMYDGGSRAGLLVRWEFNKLAPGNYTSIPATQGSGELIDSRDPDDTFGFTAMAWPVFLDSRSSSPISKSGPVSNGGSESIPNPVSEKSDQSADQNMPKSSVAEASNEQGQRQTGSSAAGVETNANAPLFFGNDAPRRLFAMGVLFGLFALHIC